MKHLFYFLLLALVACSKDSPEEQTTLSPKTVMFVEDFAIPNLGREGEKAPFGFDESWTIIDVFEDGKPQLAINQNPNVTDRFELNRVPLSPNVNYNGIKSLYLTDFYFADSTDNFSAKIYWDYLNGESNILYPNATNNQLDNVNPNSWVKITRKSKTQDYFDMYCGKEKKLVEHLVETQNFTGNILIQSNRCNNNLYSFKYY